MRRLVVGVVLCWMPVICWGQQAEEAPRFRPGTTDDRSASDHPAREPRIWVDSTGRFQAEATLVSRDGDHVTLRNADGVVVRVAMDRLSRRDQRYLDRIAADRPGMIRQGARTIAKAAEALTNGLASNPTRADVGNQSTPLDRTERPDRGAAAEDETKRFFDGPPLPSDLVHVQVSRTAMSKMLSRPVTRQVAVNDTIVGTPVRGTAHTDGWTDLRLVPSQGRAVVDVVFHGRIQSQTIGFGGPVQVHSSGTTRFNAIKRLMLDEHGVEVLPAQVSAQTSTSINGVSTSLPRLRGRIARRIGSERAAQLKPAADAEAARKAEMRIARQFDEEVAGQLLDARDKLAQVLSSLPVDRDLLAGQMHFTTSRDHLHLAIHRGAGERSRVRPPTPAEFGSPDLAVHVHASLVDRVVRNVELQRTLEPLVNMLLADQAQWFVGVVPSQPKIELKQSRDGTWWSLIVRDK